MSPATVFDIHLLLGYVTWLLCFGTYFWPKLKAMDRIEAQRAIATLHSFRFFGLVFIIPGVVGPNLPTGFAEFAAYGDFATGLLATLALLTVRAHPLFWPFVVAYNVVGTVDIIVDYYHGTMLDLPALSGQLAATYWIPIIYVPLLMITHVAALYLLLRPQSKVASKRAGAVAISQIAIGLKPLQRREKRAAVRTAARFGCHSTNSERTRAHCSAVRKPPRSV